MGGAAEVGLGVGFSAALDGPWSQGSVYSIAYAAMVNGRLRRLPAVLRSDRLRPSP
jgi:hypothetical protein